MRKLILRSFLSPGDIVMLTAAIRDLHTCYPGRFVTDVRTSCPDLWEHNPYLTPLAEDERGVEILDSKYPLINHANERPYHCLHGFIDFLNQRLKLHIKPTLFKGDIHLTEQEKLWYSQVHELTRKDLPFWIVVAGGKYDVTIKWWDAARFQKVVDYFRGNIQFVQVGEVGHYHPRLDGVIDLRGQTSLRELVRLVYHAQGVLCPVTSLMHLAPAIEVKYRPLHNRPCVVVAGGREPVHWEAYPDHQFIHTTGMLPCCSNGGCWKARTVPLGDGDERDHREQLCVDVVDRLPRCMHMISAEEVIRRIEGYFAGGALEYLSPSQRAAAGRGVRASLSNQYDDAPLTLHNARLACERFICEIPPYPDAFAGRGIVICGGGVKYFPCAWVCINMLRKLGCTLPIEFWHLHGEMDTPMRALVAPLGVKCIDAEAMRKKQPVRRIGGWELKPYAILYSRFREVLFLDADNVPVRNPEFLFETTQFRDTGAIFWPDFEHGEQSKVAWQSCGLIRGGEPEFESGQIVVDKERCWRALRLTLWFNEHSDFYYQHLYGDKETFHLAFQKLKQTFTLIDTPIQPLKHTMCQHDFEGKRLFQHRNTDKWNLFLHNKRVEDFWFEEDCREFVRQLQVRWDGRTDTWLQKSKPRARRQPPILHSCVISCAEREKLRNRTLRNLRRTDWGDNAVLVQLDQTRIEDRQERQWETALRALRRSLKFDFDYLLFLEDDLIFNRHLRHNLLSWPPLRNGTITLGSLYNPGLRASACDIQNRAWVVAPESVFGSQAFLVSRHAAEYFVEHWHKIEGCQDIKMSRLAKRLKRPIYYHAPSLVQHVGKKSTWGGFFHQAPDFDAHWKA